jgi:hypothetical protein
LLWGFKYGNDLVPAKEEKAYRLSRANGNSIFGIERSGVLAKDPADSYIDYFSLLGTYYSRQNLHYE